MTREPASVMQIMTGANEEPSSSICTLLICLRRQSAPRLSAAVRCPP